MQAHKLADALCVQATDHPDGWRLLYGTPIVRSELLWGGKPALAA